MEPQTLTWLPVGTPALVLQAVIACAALLACYLAWQRYSSPNEKAYLVDFHCFKIPDRLKINTTKFCTDGRKQTGWFTEDSWDFQQKVVERSGIGEETNSPDGVLAMQHGDFSKIGYNASYAETEEIIYSVAENLLAKTKVSPDEIGIVMVSCSCFVPQPSMAAMLVKRLGLRADVLTYNFAGMGCASSLICVDLARHMLAALPNTLALVVNHENLTNNWYNGNDKSMLVCNCLFRVGGAAALISNRPCDRDRAKYELATTLRTHLGNEDDAYLCMGVGEDVEGVRGVFLRKNVVPVAGRALTRHLRELAPRVLPLTELAKCIVQPSYIPDFGRAFDHFLLHTGGRGVLEALEEALRLSPKQMQPSKDTLFTFGNTSAASTWYILAKVESSVGVKKGDRFWQLGFGGGFKCNSAVWKARRAIKQQHDCWQ